MNKAGSRPEGVEDAHPSDVIGCLVSYQGFSLSFPVQFKNARDEVRIVNRLAISYKLQESLAADSHAREPWQLEQMGNQLRPDRTFCCHALSLFKHTVNPVPLVCDRYFGMGIDHSLEQRRARACTAHDEYIRIDDTGLRQSHLNNSPSLRLQAKATASCSARPAMHAPEFPTRTGRRRTKDNVRARVILPDTRRA